MSAVHLLGVPISNWSLPELLEKAQVSIHQRRAPFIFACANPHSLVVARRDAAFRHALRTASVVVADGVGCVLGATIAGTPLATRITGSDFFASMMTRLNVGGGRVYFLGSTREVLAKLDACVRRDYPRVVIVMQSPPFGKWSEADNDEVIADIRTFDPDVLWVGMTAPKQEKWVAQNVDRLAVPVIGSIGAVFDYYAGVTRRAPDWVCRAGLEWLYRLPREPKRLWRRTFVSAPMFLWCVLLERFHGRRASPSAAVGGENR